jgi:hypothetical protein
LYKELHNKGQWYVENIDQLDPEEYALALYRKLRKVNDQVGSSIFLAIRVFKMCLSGSV